MEVTRQDPRYNVVSVRVTDEERLFLEEQARVGGKTVSVLLREVLILWRSESWERVLGEKELRRALPRKPGRRA
jgi:hypothetical protein